MCLLESDRLSGAVLMFRNGLFKFSIYLTGREDLGIIRQNEPYSYGVYKIHLVISHCSRWYTK